MRRAAAVVADIVNNNLAPIVVGANALEVEDIWQKVYTKQAQTHGPGWSLYKALSGVDMALWDVRGKALGQPVYRLLGGSRKKIRAYAGGVCLGFQPPPRLLEEAQSFVAKGYTALKLRLGDSVERDVERVRHVRAALGDKIDIMCRRQYALFVSRFTACPAGPRGMPGVLARRTFHP